MTDFFDERLHYPQYVPSIPQSSQVEFLSCGLVNWVASEAFTPTGGKGNRLLIAFWANSGGNPPSTPTSITFGGVEMHTVLFFGGNQLNKENHGFSYLLEHEIPSGASQFSITSTNSGWNDEIHVIELANVDQQKPVAGANHYWIDDTAVLNAGNDIVGFSSVGNVIYDGTTPISLLYGRRGQYYVAAGPHRETPAANIDRDGSCKGFNERLFSSTYDGVSDTSIHAGPVQRDGSLGHLTWGYDITSASGITVQAALINPVGFKKNRRRPLALADVPEEIEFERLKKMRRRQPL